MRWRLYDACDKFDATEGWVAAEALKAWFKRKGI